MHFTCFRKFSGESIESTGHNSAEAECANPAAAGLHGRPLPTCAIGIADLHWTGARPKHGDAYQLNIKKLKEIEEIVG